MEEQPPSEPSIYPANLNTIALPNDAGLKRAFEVYKPSIQTIQLLSEQGRTVFPEVFIENYHLGTLRDLCTAVLARSFGPHPLPIVAEDPVLLQKHYDALDVDLPLAECYQITEERYWKRVVSEKHEDKTLTAKPNVDWKNLGVALKYVELVEACPAEYWPEEEMKELALKVKEFVTEMHIRHLQSLGDRSFEKNFQSESEESEQEEEESSSDESLLTTSTEEQEEEEDIAGEGEEAVEKTASQLELEAELAKQKALRKKERQELREAKQKAREAKLKEANPDGAKTPQEEELFYAPENIFDLEVSESEDDGEDRIVDKRNKALLLSHIKKYDYPAEDCHHIDLRFIQYFTKLETFTIEFWGPIQNRNFHKRHLNFSYNDIKNLSTGLRYLPQLKVFRLRNSSMDADKLQILSLALGALPRLETLDLGHDQLKDDCGSVFEELFKSTESLKSLELESNFLSEEALQLIGEGLKAYEAAELSYLGLARNPITDKALHALVSLIVGTKHVEHLNIKGLVFLTEVGICCCVANELLRKHPPLIKLDISAIKISPMAADEIIKALDKNHKVLEFKCNACDLDEETEIDVNVLMNRNKFISENYFVGDMTVTNEEVTKWLNRTKNPLLLKVLAEREAQKECLQNRTEESIPLPYLISPEISQHSSLDIKYQIYERDLEEDSSMEIKISPEEKQPFVYETNDFDEQQFLEHVCQPGPQERYYYFKTYKKKYLITDYE